ncbi:hypothetical protein CLV84_1429 [Neolewinella xylanilytica]|uniref:Uncharacterized protein n=1 Tax=Neolewinella xylanilytica TaxID=1514080 RepID=A0A2S6IAF9_9BACT|nr:hypothetical protein [Neolewinella xylanilytica]PPK88462.1 hypothetical protein CLV84_1429 [Neolewinella xylanilytica]
MLSRCLSTLFPILLVFCSCQSSPRGERTEGATGPTAYDTLTDADFPANFPRYPLLFSDSLQRGLAAGHIRPGFHHPWVQIGKYGTINREAELPLEWDLDSLLPDARAALNEYRLIPAEAVIAERARDANLLIITEAHTKPEHRVFTRCLLDDLYAEGYRHLGLENITPLRETSDSRPWDSLLHERGYPLMNYFSGIYPSEPEYGNLLRHAIDLGFRIFAYEHNGSSDSERDLQQAEHIVAYQRAHPGEKIVCHGGWYHAIEDATEKRPGSDTYWMAYHYRELTGDDPLTVYQDALNEKVATEQASSPYYAALRDRLEPGGTPQVLVNAAGELWRGPHGDMPFDIVTVTPPLGSTDRRRGWEGWSCDGRAYANVDLRESLGAEWNKLSFPAIVEVRGEFDSPVATPIYASELMTSDDDRSVRLWKGRYRILLRDASGRAAETVVAR